MTEITVTRRDVIVIGSVLIIVVAVIIGASIAGSYTLALAALHNHANLTVTQSCAHWERIAAATANDGTPQLHAAVTWTLGQLKCTR